MIVKICGITNLEDARIAVDAGADLIGFILYPKSPRYVDPATIATITAALRLEHEDAAPGFVGVFVNTPLAEIRTTMSTAGLDYAQLHGNETADALTALAGRAYKALRPATADQARTEAAHFFRTDPAPGPRLMVDAYDPAEYGGTGKKADWHAAAQLAEAYRGFLLAGGLTPANVAAAVGTVRPWGVDVASGVEATPGRKDHAKVYAFVANAKAAGQLAVTTGSD